MREKEQLELMKQLSRIALESIRAATPVRRFGRLRKGIRALPVTTKRATIFSIYYWTRFMNFGRKAINAGPKRPLIFFKDPRKDPRIRGDYPRRKKDIVKLTRRQFKYHRKAGNLIITNQVDSQPAERFLERGLRVARKKIPAAVLDRIRKDVRSNLTRRRDSVTVRL